MRKENIHEKCKPKLSEGKATCKKAGMPAAHERDQLMWMRSVNQIRVAMNVKQVKE